MKASGHGALHIPQDTLEHRQMRLSRVVHEETHMLNSVGEIQMGQREVLESTYEAAVLGSILHWSAIRSGELSSSVHRCRYRVTLGHAGTLEQIHSILALGEEEATRGPCDSNPEKVMEVPKICHGELVLKKLGDAPK